MSALSGFCNPSNPVDSHERCHKADCPCIHHRMLQVVPEPAESYDPAMVEAITNPVEAVGHAVHWLERKLPELTEACTDPQATDLALLFADVQEARAKLQGLERDLEDQLAKAMLADDVATDTVRVERYRSRDRKAWDHDAWRRDVQRQLLRKHGLLGVQALVTRDGEQVEAAGVLHQLLAEAYDVQGAKEPKTTGLRSLGLDPADYCETAPGVAHVRVTRMTDTGEGEA